MKKKLKDILPLYIGAPFADNAKDFDNVTIDNLPIVYVMMDRGDWDGKLILFPLSTMTEDEMEELEAMFPKDENGLEDEADEFNRLITNISGLINELRHRHYDCDGLIDAGLAINGRELA